MGKGKFLVYTIAVATDPSEANPQGILDAIRSLDGVEKAEIVGSRMRHVVVEG